MLQLDRKFVPSRWQIVVAKLLFSLEDDFVSRVNFHAANLPIQQLAIATCATQLATLNLPVILPLHLNQSWKSHEGCGLQLCQDRPVHVAIAIQPLHDDHAQSLPAWWSTTKSSPIDGFHVPVYTNIKYPWHSYDVALRVLIISTWCNISTITL